MSTTVLDVVFHATAISMDDMKKMDEFMATTLSAAKYLHYKGQSEASASASWSLFGGPKVQGGAKASRDAMTGFGLSAAQQEDALHLVAKFFPQPSTFKYTSTINNTSEWGVSGQMYVYAFTGNVKVDNEQSQKQFIGGPVAKTTGGDDLPTVNKPDFT